MNEMDNRKELFKDIKNSCEDRHLKPHHKGRKFNREFANDIAREVSKLKSKGKDVILVLLVQ